MRRRRSGYGDHLRAPVLISDPRPEAVRLELTRAVRRWQQLPLDRASALRPVVRDVAARLLEAMEVSDPLPALPPAATMDQLRVVVFDACARRDRELAEVVLAELIALRRAID